MLAAQQVVVAIAGRLVGLPIAGPRVFTNRTWPTPEKDLPAWKVFSVDEDVTPITVHEPFVEQHALQVELHGIRRQTDDLDDALNDMASEALKALFGPTPPADDLLELKPKVLLSCRRIERGLPGDGEAAIGLVNLTVRAEFQTLSNDPDTIL